MAIHCLRTPWGGGGGEGERRGKEKEDRRGKEEGRDRRKERGECFGSVTWSYAPPSTSPHLGAPCAASVLGRCRWRSLAAGLSPPLQGSYGWDEPAQPHISHIHTYTLTHTHHHTLTAMAPMPPPLRVLRYVCSWVFRFSSTRRLPAAYATTSFANTTRLERF